KIIKQGGSAIDTAIATGLCNGIANFQSMGIGGGHFLLYFNKTENKVYAINARERAPINSELNMFKNQSSEEGGLASGIPGEIKGYWEAHKRWGKLDWKQLFEDAIDMCINGFKLSKALASAVKQYRTKVLNDEALRRVFIDPSTNLTHPENTTIKMLHLGETLRRISEDPESFYSGELASEIVEEMNAKGGNVTLEDFNSYSVVVNESEPVMLKDGMKVFTLPPPSSGLMISFIMNVMKGFDFSPVNNKNVSNQTQLNIFYHRLIETFKHAYAKRTFLGDSEFVNVSKVVDELTSESHANLIRKKIVDSTTFPSTYYGTAAFKEDHGTAHISILHPSGDAVGLTATINLFLGAKYAGVKTGIVYNNEMDDFSTPGKNNYFGFQASEANYIVPRKHPMSSMSPIIVTDSNNRAVLVVGASGGSKIISAVSQVAIKTLWLNKSIVASIRERRVHHQLSPPELEIEKGFSRLITLQFSSFNHIEKSVNSFSFLLFLCFNNANGVACCLLVCSLKGGLPDGE
ncbi:unnamed protein product, partial [Sphagnum balticum]